MMPIKLTKCSICSKKKFQTYFKSMISLTSDRQVIFKDSQVGYCNNCNLILNHKGVRRKKNKFYYEEYNLNGKKAEDEFRIYSKNNSGTESEIMANFFLSNSKINRTGSFIEIGAGKGLFLNQIKKKLKNYNFSAIEPSKYAAKYFKKNLPDVDFQQSVLENTKFLKKKFDIVASTGVIEHVYNPVLFLKLVLKMLKRNGVIFLGVPNFANKPDDLIVYDHLTKFTEKSLDNLYKKLNIELLKRKTKHNSTWIWDILKLNNNKKSFKTKVKVIEDKKLLRNNVSKIIKLEKKYLEYIKNNDKLIFYGLGNIGFYFYFKFLNKNKKLIYIVLDNDNLRGTKFFGAKIISRNDLKKLKLLTQNIYISANPKYHKIMKNNLIKENFKGRIFY